MWDDLASETQEALLDWYNCVEVPDEVKDDLAKLFKDGNFAHWECPECDRDCYFGSPKDWGNYQGVRQGDYTSYAVDVKDGKLHPDYAKMLCDECRRTKQGSRYVEVTGRFPF
jgi:hypothetical protein